MSRLLPREDSRFFDRLLYVVVCYTHADRQVTHGSLFTLPCFWHLVSCELSMLAEQIEVQDCVTNVLICLDKKACDSYRSASVLGAFDLLTVCGHNKNAALWITNTTSLRGVWNHPNRNEKAAEKVWSKCSIWQKGRKV